MVLLLSWGVKVGVMVACSSGNVCCRNCVEKLVDRDGKDAECPVCCTKVTSWFALQMLVPAASHVRFVAPDIAFTPSLAGWNRANFL